MQLEEENLEQPIKWVIKQVKDYEHLNDVPADIAKQYMAALMADAFTKVLKKTYPDKQYYLRYIKPFLAIPMYRQEKPFLYELEEYKGDVMFENFNRPNNQVKFEGRDSTLLNAFSHWTYEATGGNFIVVDIQGWRAGHWQYVLTDPIVFSTAKSLKNVDWGQNGIKNWMNHHINDDCKEVCGQIPMEYDKELTETMMSYMNRFTDASFDGILNQLELIAAQ